jgi:hypothetical protein
MAKAFRSPNPLDIHIVAQITKTHHDIIAEETQRALTSSLLRFLNSPLPEELQLQGCIQKAIQLSDHTDTDSIHPLGTQESICIYKPAQGNKAKHEAKRRKGRKSGIFIILRSPSMSASPYQTKEAWQHRNARF